MRGDATLRHTVDTSAADLNAILAHRLMFGHGGFTRGVLTTRGCAAHTARRDEEIDAIAMMARVIVALADRDEQLHAEAPHPLLGHSAVVTSTIQGGTELFTYPAACEALFAWRTLPGQIRASLTADLHRLFGPLKERDARFAADVTWRLWREPMLIDPDPPIARAAAHAIGDEGGSPACRGAPWWTDAG